MAKLKATMRPMLDLEESKEVVKLHASLLASLREFESSKYSEWGKGVDDVSQSKLKQPLLRRDAESEPAGLLAVNFDPDLVKLLREVKYFLDLQKAIGEVDADGNPRYKIPDAAAELFKKAETYRVQIGNLELIVGKYNHVLQTVLDVEAPLLQTQLKAIDKQVEKGLKHLTWRSHSIDEFVRETTTMVKECWDTLMAVKSNMAAIEGVLDKWAENPLMTRKAGKTYLPEEFEEDNAKYLAVRYQEIESGGKEIAKLLLASNRVLKVSKGAPIWKAYVEFINDIVIDGLARTVANSLKYLNEQLDPAEIAKNETVPLIEILLELDPPEVQYVPQLTDGGAAAGGTLSLKATVDKWVAGFFHACKLVKRLDRSDGDFLKEVIEHEMVRFYPLPLRPLPRLHHHQPHQPPSHTPSLSLLPLQVRFYVHSIQKHAADNALECDEFKQPYAAFSHLWTRDIAGAVKDFLVEKAVPIEEEAAAAAEGDAAPKEEGKASSFGGALAPTPEPALSDFDEQIDMYRRQALDIGALSTSATRGWLKLDAKPVKQALSTWVTKWKFAYTQHLQTSVIDRLSELKAFMEATVGGLATEVEPDDVAALVQAMTFIRDVRVRTDTIDALFEPLRGTVALLKKYSITLSESTMELLARERAVPVGGHEEGDAQRAREAQPLAGAAGREDQGGGRGLRVPRLRLPQGVPRRRRRRAVQARVRRGVLRLARPLAPQDRRARGGGGDAQREVRALRRGGGAVQGDQAVPPGHPRAQARVGPRRARRAHLRRLALDAVARRRRRRDDARGEPAAEGGEGELPEGGAELGRVQRDVVVAPEHARRAAPRPGSARRGDARAPLEETDADLRQELRDGRQVLALDAAGARARSRSTASARPSSRRGWN